MRATEMKDIAENIALKEKVNDMYWYLCVAFMIIFGVTLNAHFINQELKALKSSQTCSIETQTKFSVDHIIPLESSTSEKK